MKINPYFCFFLISAMVLSSAHPGEAHNAPLLARATSNIYYVDRNNTLLSDNNPGTEALPWKTIQHASDSVSAGDTVYVKPGLYPERVQPHHSGVQGAPITFQALPRRTVTMWGFYTHGANAITLSGVNITTDASLKGWTDPEGVFIDSNDVTVIDIYFYDLQAAAITGYWHDPYPMRAHVVGNTIFHSQMGIVITGYSWLVENNEVTRLYNYGNGDSDYSRFFGNDHVIRGNYFHNSIPSEFGSAHVDCFQTFDNNGEFVNNVLIEGNRCSEFHEGFMGEGSFHHNITHITFANNLFIHSWAWGLCVVDIANLTAVSNTFYDIAFHGIGLRQHSPTGLVMNNIFSHVETSYWYESGSSIVGDYNLIDGAQAPTLAGAHDQLKADPQFVDAAHDDYHLKATSPAVDSGMPLPQALQDFDESRRPQLKTWDIGAFEYLPPLSLGVVPGNGALVLTWKLNSGAPTGWRVFYSPNGGNPPSPIADIPAGARTFQLNGLTNRVAYGLTLTATNGSTDLFSATVQAVPDSHQVSLPIVAQGF